MSLLLLSPRRWRRTSVPPLDDSDELEVEGDQILELNEHDRMTPELDSETISKPELDSNTNTDLELHSSADISAELDGQAALTEELQGRLAAHEMIANPRDTCELA